MRTAMKSRWLWLGIGLGVVLCVLADVWQAGEKKVPRPFLPNGVVASPGGKSVVAIVGSDDPGLSSPAPLTVRPEYADDPHSDVEARLNAAQVEEMVYKALNLDTSERSIREVVQPGDWVVVKPNIVTCPDGRGVRTAYGQQQNWNRGSNRGQDHWGQNTDLRVVRAVIRYLIEVDGDARRITVAEGGAEWRKLGEIGTDPDQEHDGWTAHWEPFDSLSYVDIVAEFQHNAKGIEVDIVDLNYDDYVDRDGNVYPWTNHNPSGAPIPVPDPNGTGVTWFQRPEGFYVSKTLLECDKLINLPVMKGHDIPGETTIHKQYVGTYMQNAYGASWGKHGLHGDGDENVPNGFIDLFSYRPTDYAVVESIWGGDGIHQSADDVKLNVVVAGGDPVATEAVVAEIMGFNPYDIYHLHLSAAKGFGTWDRHQIEIVGRSLEEVPRVFHKPSSWILGPMGVTRWLIHGPHEGVGSIDEDLLGGEATVLPKEGDVTHGSTWRRVARDLRDRSPLSLGEGRGMVHYAFTWVQSDEERTVRLIVKGQGRDLFKVWLNGAPVMDSGKYSIEESVPLHEGMNALLVKVFKSAGKSLMMVALRDEDQNTPLGTQYMLSPPATAVEDAEERKPAVFKLSQNYPNPFNASTWIAFELAQGGHVALRVYTSTGQQVRTLVDKELPAGIPYTVFWNGRDAEGQDVASGVYLAKLFLDGSRRSEPIKMTLMR